MNHPSVLLGNESFEDAYERVNKQKVISDEEIMQLYEEYIETQYISESNVIAFAKAILRKAEK